MLQLESPTKESYSGARFQPKLKIGQPGDKYEQEADAVADRVMRMSETETMQMQPVEEEEELMQPKLRMQPIEEEEEPIQMKCAKCEKEEEMLQPKSNEGNVATPSVEKQIHSSTGTGNNLPVATNQFMSNAIGADFSDVKIHTGSSAVHMNKQLKSRAFTYGNNIYFNNGEYRPESSTGKNLLAHELTHVVQQKTRKKKISKKGFSSTINFRQRLFSRIFNVPKGNLLTANINTSRVPEGCTMPQSFTVYLYNTLEKKYEIAVTYNIDSTQEYTWKGLSGGDYQFIFILKDAAEGCALNGTLTVTMSNATDNIVPVIRKYVGSTKWAYSAKTPPGENTNKCNQFVFEALNEVGASVPMMQRYRYGFRRPDHPPLAGQWADPGTNISGWAVVKKPQPGDVVAEAINYSDASGHVGIVSSVNADGTGTTISATSDEVVENDWGFREGQNVVFKRYGGK